MRQGNFFNVADMVMEDNESSVFNHRVATEHYRTPRSQPPFEKEFAIIEHMIAEYDSLVDSALSMGCVDMRYERPRAAPAVPKRDLPDSPKQRGVILTKVSTKPKLVPRSFRRLRLNIQHPNQSRYRSQSNQASPEWACRTSLAIEAGKIGIDDVYTHGANSTLNQKTECFNYKT